MMRLSRRTLLIGAASFAALPPIACANAPRVLEWKDLIPAGVPYSQIIGEGKMDAINDTWLPVFDKNATNLNKDLNGAYIKMPGYMLPFDVTSKGVTSFILVPFAGACLHSPPPPANQLVFVDTAEPWVTESMWDPIWVTGQMHHELQSTTLAEVGYAMQAYEIELYEW